LSVVASVDDQLVVRRERILDADLQRAWIALLAIRTGIVERYARRIASNERFAGPERLVEAATAAVKAVRPIVERETIRRPVECEPPVRDAVCITTDDRAEVLMLALVARGYRTSTMSSTAAAIRRTDDGHDSAEVMTRTSTPCALLSV
jgi:hypothetical protein